MICSGRDYPTAVNDGTFIFASDFASADYRDLQTLELRDFDLTGLDPDKNFFGFDVTHGSLSKLSIINCSLDALTMYLFQVCSDNV